MSEQNGPQDPDGAQPPGGQDPGGRDPQQPQQPPASGGGYGQPPGAYGDQGGYAQQPGPYGGQPVPGGQPTDEERNWAIAAHAGSFVAAYVALGFLAPLLVLLVKGKDSPYIRAHAVESLNFQLSALVYILVSAVLVLVLVGIFMLAAVAIFYLVVVILASIKASEGGFFRYPLTMRLVS